MPRSMTAFARRDRDFEWGSLSWEIRSVNNRYLDVNYHLPDELRSLEGRFRERIASRLGRGKLHCSLRLDSRRDAGGRLELDHDRLRSLLGACHEIEEAMLNPARISPLEILQWPGVVEEPESDAEAIAEAAVTLLDDTLDALVEARRIEGERLDGLIRERLAQMRPLVADARERRPQVLERQRQRLRERLEGLAGSADADRLEQEMVIQAQKLDVDEELDRLEAHLDEVARVLGREEPIGRRLDFIMQELNREANTLGSKSADTATTRASVEMKVLIEQMREQVQNIE